MYVVCIYVVYVDSVVHHVRSACLRSDVRGVHVYHLVHVVDVVACRSRCTCLPSRACRRCVACRGDVHAYHHVHVVLVACQVSRASRRGSSGLRYLHMLAALHLFIYLRHAVQRRIYLVSAHACSVASTVSTSCCAATYLPIMYLLTGVSHVAHLW